MKTNYKYFLAALALIAMLPSCKKEGKPDVPQDITPISVISASIPVNGMIPAGQDLYGWDAGGAKFVYENTLEGNPASFSLCEEQKVPEHLAYASYSYAVPDSLFRGKMFIRLIDEQTTDEAGAPDKDAFIYVGHMNGAKTELQPIFGYVKFTVNQKDVNSLTFTTTTPGTSLAGGCRIEMYETPKISAPENASQSIILSKEGGFEQGKSYTMAVLAGDFTNFNAKFVNAHKVTVWDSNLEGDFRVLPGQTLDLGNFGNPDVSSLELTFNSEQYVGYTVKSVIGYSEATKKRILGGDVMQTFEAGKAIKAAFYGLEPADYSSSNIWFVFTMEKDGKSAVLPISVPGFVIGKATVVSKDLGVISESRNAAPWYYPYEDTRVKVGAGYAFGDANTYFIQYKGGTYKGATLTPNELIPDEVVIDYRVRGDLFSAPSPENVHFEWLMGYGGDGTWKLHTSDRSKINANNGILFEFTQDAEHYTVTVKNKGALADAPILVMKDADNKVLWSWAFWNIAADGTRLTPVPFGNAELLPIDIGQPTTVEHAQALTTAVATTELRRFTYYYQWGRSTPFFGQYQNYVYAVEGDSRCDIAGKKARFYVHDAGVVSPEESITYPGAYFINPFEKGVANVSLDDWILGGVETHKDLWGGVNTTTEGVKTTFDPCPKGYRVADAKTYLDVFPEPVKGYDVATYPQSHIVGYQGVYVADNVLFTCSGNFAPKVSNTGAIGNNGAAYGTGNTANNNAHFWTNTWKSGNTCYTFRADYQYSRYDKGSVNADREISVSSKSTGIGLAVRCQVDKDNR